MWIETKSHTGFGYINGFVLLIISIEVFTSVVNCQITASGFSAPVSDCAVGTTFQK